MNLNKKIEFDRLPVKPIGKPVKPAGKPVKPTGKPFETGWTCDFEFDRFPPVSGQTGLVGLLNPGYHRKAPAVVMAGLHVAMGIFLSGAHHKAQSWL